MQPWNHLEILSKEKIWIILSISEQQSQEPTGKKDLGQKGGRRKDMFCQVWLKLLCGGQISNGCMIESKYLTSVYISDSNEQELLTQAAHLVNILGSRTRIEL